MNCSVVATQPLGRATLLTVSFPALNEAPSVAGRFFLARCHDGDALDRAWDPCLRRVLRPVAYTVKEGAPLYTLLVAADEDPGYRWLAARRPGDAVDLLGPAGAGFALEPRARALLLVADLSAAPLLFPLMHEMLDRGGRVTLLVRMADDALTHAFPLDLLLHSLPLAVEARAEPATAFSNVLADMVPWADSVCLAMESRDPAAYADVARVLRAKRLRLDAGFAQVLWLGPVPCGIGACLACLVPMTGGGFTRACVHGPVIDLTKIAA